MATKHTPGPWTLKSWHESEIVTTQDCDPIAMVYADKNRKLIAAAPEMLEALQYIVNWTPDKWNPEKARDLARAAIAKATGDSDTTSLLGRE